MNSLIPGTQRALKNCKIIRDDMIKEQNLALSALHAMKFMEAPTLNLIKRQYNEKIEIISEEIEDMEKYLKKLEAGSEGSAPESPPYHAP